ncbi:hypothetical protein [Leclercia sp.]|uniref:hypothetical protein n=1 Tax=Leclercia sp. TaxID=1898428 RepID=UPI002FDDA1EC
MNWIFYKGRWYLITPLPLNREYRLSIPGERGYLILSRQQLKIAVSKSLALSVLPEEASEE